MYRDGSRDAQVLSTGATAKQVVAEANGEPQAAAAALELVDEGELAQELAAALRRIAQLEAQLEGKDERIASLEGGMMRQPAMRSRPRCYTG